MFDLTAATASIVNLVQNINSAVTTMVGLDTLYCRAVPAEKAEDVILEEYSLLNVECPKPLRVVTSKTDYQPGNYNVDLFGITYEQPFEIAIDISTWQKTYGKDIIPQKSDIVYVKIVHKLYEVLTSTIVYTVNELPTSFKVQLSKYNPSLSRRESKDLKQSIDDLTVSQQELFGEEISNEVADITDPISLDYNHNTVVDPYKNLENKDMPIYNFIKAKDLRINGNLFSVAHYDFIDASENIVYNRSAKYILDSSLNYWIYSAWVKTENNIDDNIYIKLKQKLGAKWVLSISTETELIIGNTLQIYRGSILNVAGTVISQEDKNTYIIDIPISEVMKANKKLTGWESTGGWKIKAINKYNLLTGYDENNSENLIFDIKANSIYCTFGKGNTSKFDLPENIDMTKWHYIALIISPIINKCFIIERLNNGKSKVLLNLETKNNKKNINISKFSINNINVNMQLTNIRLYENHYNLSEKEFIMDAESRYSKNASRLIISDDTNIENQMPYIGQAK